MLILFFVILNIFNSQQIESNINDDEHVELYIDADEQNGDCKTFNSDYEEIGDCAWTDEQEKEFQQQIDKKKFTLQKFYGFHQKFIQDYVMKFDCLSGQPYCYPIFFLTNGVFSDYMKEREYYNPESEHQNETQYHLVVQNLSHKIGKHLQDSSIAILLVGYDAKHKPFHYPKRTSNIDLFYYLKKWICFFDAEFCEEKLFILPNEHIIQMVMFTMNEICIHYRNSVSEKKCITIEENN